MKFKIKISKREFIKEEPLKWKTYSSKSGLLQQLDRKGNIVKYDKNNFSLDVVKKAMEDVLKGIEYKKSYDKIMSGYLQNNFKK